MPKTQWLRLPVLSAGAEHLVTGSPLPRFTTANCTHRSTKWHLVATLGMFLASVVLRQAHAQEVFRDWQTPSEVTVSTGQNHEIIPHGRGGVSYFPDEVICVLREKPLTFTMVCGDSTYVWAGANVASATPVAKVLSPGEAGSPDNNYAGVGGIYHDRKGRRIIGIYHAEDKEGIGKVDVNGVQGFYGTVCAAEVAEDGNAFKKLGPAIKADKPKLPRGWETEGGPPQAWMAQGVGGAKCVHRCRRWIPALLLHGMEQPAEARCSDLRGPQPD